jgi:glucan phosphoethanolaminetransferase (alkaline phosphatase superfamily)
VVKGGTPILWSRLLLSAWIMIFLTASGVFVITLMAITKSVPVWARVFACLLAIYGVSTLLYLSLYGIDDSVAFIKATPLEFLPWWMQGPWLFVVFALPVALIIAVIDRTRAQTALHFSTLSLAIVISASAVGLASIPYSSINKLKMQKVSAPDITPEERNNIVAAARVAFQDDWLLAIHADPNRDSIVRIYGISKSRGLSVV